MTKLPSMHSNLRAHRSSSSLRRLAADTRGASMVEYAIMLFLVMVVAAIAVRSLGKTSRSGFDHATVSF
jgi:Flp pilus assembly pilin Flp